MAASVGIKGLKLDRETFLIRERSIMARLNKEPLIDINEMVVWEIDELDREKLPNNKRARNIHFDAERGMWQRRVLTDWKVHVTHIKNAYHVHKQNGLNLETNKGFHLINRGLSTKIHPSSFSKAKISYPIFVSRKIDPEIQIDYLKRGLVKNLKHLYDPFTWVARRNARFRGGFYRELLSEWNEQGYKVNDRKWFGPAFCRFLSDRMTLKRHGEKEIYKLWRVQNSMLPPNYLGTGLDFLNWNEGENREGKAGRKRDPLEFGWNFNNLSQARFVFIDVEQQYGDTYFINLRGKLLALKKKVSGQDLMLETLEEVTGMPNEEYFAAAFERQKANIRKHTK